MAMRSTCPSCSQEVSAPEEFAGKQVKCPKCAAVFTLPAVDALDEPVPMAPRRPRDEPRGDSYRDDDYRDDDYRDDDYRGDQRRGDERRSDERRSDERRSDERRRERRFRCPYCNSGEMPRVTEEISVGGWVVFAVLLLFCIPLCWIPLITMKEQRRFCYDCGMKLG